MGEGDLLALRFVQNRIHRAAAYQTLGSLSDAADAVQETWLRLSRSDTNIENLGGWLTTVTGRGCWRDLQLDRQG